MKPVSSGPCLAALFLVTAWLLTPFAAVAQTPGYLVMLTPPAPPSITAFNGGVANSTIIVVPLNGFTGRITFTCSLTGGTPPPTCSTPLPVNVVSNPTAETLKSFTTITSVRNTKSGSFTLTVNATSDRGVAPLGAVPTMPITIEHQLSAGNEGGGGSVAVISLAVLLAAWSMTRLRRRRSVAAR